MRTEVEVHTAAHGLVRLAIWWYPPEPGGPERPVLVGLPGGTYDHGYFDLDVPGHAGYSFARAATAAGFGVVAVDHLGTGASTRPEGGVGLADQADAVAGVLEQLPHLIGRDGPFVAVGHSMGGYVAMLQQARHRSYAALAVLGTTNGAVAPLDLPAEVVAAAASREGRDALVAEIVASMPDAYLDAGRADLGGWFHLPDVPSDVVAADTATTLTCVPRACAAEATVPGITAEAAAEVAVPVFLAFGDVDVSSDPHAEPASYPSSGDVTLHLVAGSGHCHNMAPGRHRLWTRLFAWSDAVVRPTG